MVAWSRKRCALSPKALARAPQIEEAPAAVESLLELVEEDEDEEGEEEVSGFGGIMGDDERPAAAPPDGGAGVAEEEEEPDGAASTNSRGLIKVSQVAVPSQLPSARAATMRSAPLVDAQY